MLSIVTPTYNRRHTLPKLYESLKENYEFTHDFEWIVVDDGSNDDTKSLILTWQKESPFTIRYFYKKNGGKMQALNFAIPKAKGDKILEVDSDDFLEKNAIFTIEQDFSLVEEKNDVYAAIYLRRFIGEENPTYFKEEKSIKKIFDLYMKEGFNKDTSIVFKANIRKKYHHKLENNEKFVTEARMYNEIDLDYRGVMCFNKSLIVCEYQEDGYSKNIDKVIKNNPYGYYNYFKEMFNLNLKKLPFNKRLYIIKHFILFSYLTKKSKLSTIKNTKGIFNKLLTTILVLPGYLVSKKRFG